MTLLREGDRADEPGVVRFSIPWAKPDIRGDERAYVADAVASTWISGGPYVDRLEHAIAGYCGVPHALAVANGTVALHLAYLAIGMAPGDEVVVPGFGFLAAANVALHMGARPVFADVDPSTWCMTAATLEQVVTGRTRAVVAVHTYGNACDMDAIVAFCRRRGIWLIEDAAESFGTRYKGQLTGAIADIGCFSFQATKTISTGEGGMVITRRDGWVEAMRLYRSHGMSRTRYLHEVAGLNFRLTNLQAALGCAQLERIESVIAGRERLIDSYRDRLHGEPGLILQTFAEAVEPVVWAVAVLLDPQAFPQGRDAVMAQLAAAGIESRPGFYAPSAMPHLYGNVGPLPVSDRISRQVVSLPSYPSLAQEDIERICATLISVRSPR